MIESNAFPLTLLDIRQQDLNGAIKALLNAELILGLSQLFTPIIVSELVVVS